MMNGVIIFIRPSFPAAQLMAGFIMCVVALVVLLSICPYSRNEDHMVGVVCICEVALVLLMGNVLKAEVASPIFLVPHLFLMLFGGSYTCTAFFCAPFGSRVHVTACPLANPHR